MIKALRPAWIFDESVIPDPLGHGERAVDFLQRLRHPKAADRGFSLPAFWERVVRRIYGPQDSHGRAAKVVFVLMPRGGRKTTIGAGLGSCTPSASNARPAAWRSPRRAPRTRPASPMMRRPAS